MNKEEIKELQEYNLDMLEALTSEEIYGGDYKSAVELKYLQKDYDKLQEQLQQKNHMIEELEKWLKELIKMYEYDVIIRERYEEMLEKLQELRGDSDE